MQSPRVAAFLLSCSALACGGNQDPGVGGGLTEGLSTTTTTGSDTTTTGAATDSDSAGEESSAGAETSGTTMPWTPDPLMVDCLTPPAAAVGAAYSHSPTKSGGVGPYTWTAMGLPPGLAIDAATGLISGTPTTAGDYVIELSLSDGQDPPESAMATCAMLSIADALSVDFSGNPNPCITVGDDLLAFVTGGDGSPITCATPAGNGNGTVAAGLSVNPDTCMIDGTLTETRYGNYVWIVEATQSGFTTKIPYCAIQATPELGDSYSISAVHGATMADELVPATGSFDPMGTSAQFGAMGDPGFTIMGPCGANFCEYGFLFAVDASPFDQFALCNQIPNPNEDPMDPNDNWLCSPPPALAFNMGMNPIGFTHGMWALGGATADPFVLNWNITYCITGNAGECVGNQNIGDNSAGHLHFGVIMLPQ